MMDKWDAEYRKLDAAINELEAPYKAIGIQANIRMLQKQGAILQYENAIENSLEKINFYTNKSLDLSPKLRSIAKWSLILAKKFKSNLESSTYIFGRGLWLQLIHMRMRQPRTFNAPLEDTDIMEFATKKVQLKGKEQRLSEELFKISQYKKKLHQRYEYQSAKRSNKEANNSTKPKDPLRTNKQNIVYQCLSDFINNISTTTRATTSLEKSFQSKQRSLIKETDKVIRACEAMATDDITPNRFTVSSHDAEELKGRIQDLEALQKEVKKLQSRVFKSKSPPLHPIMVKNSTITDTTKANV